MEPGKYVYNNKIHKVTGIQRWWLKKKGLKIELLGGLVHLDTTQKGSGAYATSSVDLITFARTARRTQHADTKDVQGGQLEDPSREVARVAAG